MQHWVRMLWVPCADMMPSGYAESYFSSMVDTKALPISWAQKPLLVPYTVSSSAMWLPQLRSLKPRAQQCSRPIQRLLNRTQGVVLHLLSRPCPEGPIKSQSESFRYHPGGGVYRCMLCLRQFDSESSLQSHESLSDLHQSNLENPSSVAQGRSRLVKILRSTVNELVEDWIATKPTTFGVKGNIASLYHRSGRLEDSILLEHRHASHRC